MPETLIAKGSSRNFHHEETTAAASSDIWDVWMNVGAWQSWDMGLAAAEGSVARLGATGVVIDKSGRRSPFEVIEYDHGQAYAFSTRLPGGTLVLRRSIVGSHPTRFVHHVRFTGIGGCVLSRFLGPGFRRDLPPTMAALARRAEGCR